MTGEPSKIDPRPCGPGPASHPVAAFALACLGWALGREAFAQDATPPVPGMVRDGPGPDADWQNHAVSLSANWTGFTDPESGIASYRWAIGSVPGAQDVLPFTAVGSGNSAIGFGLSLSEGAVYYVTVEATNGVALTGTATSDGIRIDTTPPGSPALLSPSEGAAVAGSSGVAFSWAAVAGASSYRFELASNSTFIGSLVLDLVLSTTSIASSPLPAGTYFWRVRASDAAGNTGPPSAISSFSATITTTGRLDAALGPASPLASNAINTAQDLAVLQVRLFASMAEDLRVTAITFTALGTADDAAHLGQVRLYLDANSDGAVQAGADPPLGLPASYPIDNGSIGFEGMSLVVPAGQWRDVLLAYSLNGTAPIASALAARIASPTHILVQGATSGEALVPEGMFPLDGAPLTIVSSGTPGGLTLRRGALSPTDGFAASGEQTVEVLQAVLTASGVEPVRVTGVVLRASGTGQDATEVANVLLAEDKDLNGVFTAGVDPVLGVGTYAVDNGSVGFTFDRTLSPGGAIALLAAYDFGPGAVAGNTFVAELRGTDIASLGLTSGSSATVSGSDVIGASKTVGSAGVTPVLVQISPVALPAPEPLLPTTRGVPALAFEFQVGTLEGVAVQLLKVKASGSGNDAVEVARAQLWEDADGSRTLTAQDRLLSSAEGPFAKDDGEVTFALAEVVPAGGSRTWLVSYDLGAGARAGTTYQASVNVGMTPPPLVATGTSSSLYSPLSGAVVVGSVLSVRDFPGSSGDVFCLASAAERGRSGGLWMGFAGAALVVLDLLRRRA